MTSSDEYISLNVSVNQLLCLEQYYRTSLLCDEMTAYTKLLSIPFLEERAALLLTLREKTVQIREQALAHIVESIPYVKEYYEKSGICLGYVSPACDTHSHLVHSNTLIDSHTYCPIMPPVTSSDIMPERHYQTTTVLCRDDELVSGTCQFTGEMRKVHAAMKRYESNEGQMIARIKRASRAIHGRGINT